MIYKNVIGVIVFLAFLTSSLAMASASDGNYHSADYNPPDYRISLSELLRVVQFYNTGIYHCSSDSNDGYAVGDEDKNCAPHDTDYDPQDWKINLKELLRLIQFYNVGGYYADPNENDKFAPLKPGSGTDDDNDGYAEIEGDCNDRDPSIHPDATEVCDDGIDQDCNGSDCGGSNNVFTIEPDNLLEFKVSIPPGAVGDLTPPLAFSVTSVRKDGAEISLPDNVIFSETGDFSWKPTAGQSGQYEFTFFIEDADENTTTQLVYITVGDVSYKEDITEVSASSAFISSSKNEKSAIQYTLAESANVTIDIYRTYVTIDGWGNGQFQREFVMTLLDSRPRAAGENSEIWDGKDKDGNLLSPSAYAYVIKAGSGEKTSTYGLEYISGSVTISEPSVSPPSYNPYANQSVEIKYNLLAPAWVTIGGHGMRGFIIEGEPRGQGENTEIWDGKNQLGEVVTGNLSLHAKAEIMPENVIVVKDEETSFITDVTAEAYVIIPSYGEISTVKYSLSREARVSVTIREPNGGNLMLLEEETQAAGEHSVEWHGTNAEGKLVWPGMTDMPEGDYTVEITARDNANQTVSKKTANIHVYR